MSTPQIPERFRVIEEVASGDIQVLYRATDLTLHREVYLKVPGPAMRKHFETSVHRERALREARALARIEGRGVVRLLDVIESESGPLLVLEPETGEALSEKLGRRSKLSHEEVLDLALSLVEALDAVHRAGIVHRGISASAILIRSDDTPCLTGFSFAKPNLPMERTSIDYRDQLKEESYASPSAGAYVPPHPAPEQYRGQPADARSDIFSLGCVLYECLAGRSPFAERILWSEPVPLEQIATDTPKPLARAIMKCLRRHPLKRFQNAEELRQALTSAGDDTAHVGRSGGQKRTLAWSAAVLVAALAFTFAWDRITSRDQPSTLGERGITTIAGDDTGMGREDVLFRPVYENSHALLIGIGDAYEPGKFQRLPNAESDIEAIASRLKTMDWENWQIRKIMGKDATREEILQGLASMESVTGPDDRILVYYAGHGIPHETAETSGWILPADALPLKQDPGRSTWIRFDEFARFFEQVEAKHILVAMDCCYSGRLATGRSASSRRYSERFLTQRAHVVVTSGRPFEEVSDGIPGEHSPFAAAFLKALNNNEETAITSSMLHARIDEEFTGQGIGHQPQLRNAPGSSGQYVFFLRKPG